MINALTYAQFICAGVISLWGILGVIRNRAVSRSLLVATALVFVLMLAQLIVSLTAWNQASHDTDSVLFFGYIITALVLLPLAWVWAYAETTRWGSAVIAGAGITVFVMIERMVQIWH